MDGRFRCHWFSYDFKFQCHSLPWSNNLPSLFVNLQIAGKKIGKK